MIMQHDTIPPCMWKWNGLFESMKIIYSNDLEKIQANVVDSGLHEVQKKEGSYILHSD